MWTCNECQTANEESVKSCVNCGTPRKEEDSMSIKKLKINSGLKGWTIVLNIIGFILIFAAVISFVMALDKHGHKSAIYIEDAIMCIASGLTTFLLSSVLNGFIYVIKAAKLYMVKNGQLEESEI